MAPTLTAVSSFPGLQKPWSMITPLSSYSNIFGFIVGGVSLLGFVVAVCRPQLPSNKIKVLENLLHETETIFKEAVEDGLLGHEFARMTEHRLVALKDRTLSLRARAYNATSFCKDYAEFLGGTSSTIGRTCRSLKMLRAEVVRFSEERRSRPVEMISAPNINITTTPSVLSLGPELQRTPTPFLSSRILRSRSCPPVFAAWKLNDVAGGRTHNPFHDPMQSDSDAGTTNAQY